MILELMNMNDLTKYKPICLSCQFFVECPGKQPDCIEYLEDTVDEHMMNA